MDAVLRESQRQLNGEINQNDRVNKNIGAITTRSATAATQPMLTKVDGEYSKAKHAIEFEKALYPHRQSGWEVVVDRLHDILWSDTSYQVQVDDSEPHPAMRMGTSKIDIQMPHSQIHNRPADQDMR